MVPAVPSASMLLPFMAPVLAPAWRRIRAPPAKVRRRIPVVAHRDSQDEQRHNLRGHKPPRPVVPGTRVPAIPLVNPVHAIVKEEVRIQSRSIVDRVARHLHQFRVQGHVDPDAHAGKSDTDAHLGHSRSGRPKQHPQHNQYVTHFLSSSSINGVGVLSTESDTAPNPSQFALVPDYPIQSGHFCALSYIRRSDTSVSAGERSAIFQPSGCAPRCSSALRPASPAAAPAAKAASTIACASSAIRRRCCSPRKLST
jgi:hypothetical protein